jgi:hypothetical protein
VSKKVDKALANTEENLAVATIQLLLELAEEDQKEIERLREALKWYADEANYFGDDGALIDGPKGNSWAMGVLMGHFWGQNS